MLENTRRPFSEQLTATLYRTAHACEPGVTTRRICTLVSHRAVHVFVHLMEARKVVLALPKEYMLFQPSHTHVTSVLSVRVFVASAESQGGVGCKWDCLLSWRHWYYLETSSNGLKNFLKCRTVGLCMTHNRLLGCHVVRSTKPVHYIFPVFISPRDRRMPRDEKHLAKHPHYPDR